jgi:DNA-binding transcriptional ArsR family regulator
MSGVYSCVEDLPAGTTWVVHRPCGAAYRVEDAADEFGDKLCCEACESNDLGSGYGTFTAREYPPTGEVMGGQPYVPVPRWILRGEGPVLAPAERAVVLALWSYEHGKASAWPTVTTLARATGYGASTVRRALDALADRGLISRQQSTGRHPNLYSVAGLIRGDLEPSDSRRVDREPSHSGSQPSHSGRVNPPTAGAEVEPSLEPRKESPSVDGVARQARNAPSSPPAATTPRCEEGEQQQLHEQPTVPVERVAVEPVRVIADPHLAERPPVPDAEAVEDRHAGLVGDGHVLDVVPALDGGLAAAGGEADSAGGGVGGFVHRDGSLGTGNGNGDVTERPGGYVGGECPDTLHCRYWKRFAAGPWSCAHCHPRVPGAAR